ncbi:hypothetical protein SARC_04152, partial [Sphaeroforma arctica JP610]
INRRINRAQSEIMAFVRGIMTAREPELVLNPECAKDNIADQFILASIEAKLDTATVEDNLAMLLFAAFNTSANTISTSLHLICRHPQAQIEINKQLKNWIQTTFSN